MGKHPTTSRRSRSGILGAVCAVLLVFAGRNSDNLTIRAAAYGTVVRHPLRPVGRTDEAGTLDGLHESVGTMLSHWYCYALALSGILGFVLQQVSLGAGRLAPSVATV